MVALLGVIVGFDFFFYGLEITKREAAETQTKYLWGGGGVGVGP